MHSARKLRECNLKPARRCEKLARVAEFVQVARDLV
jgi:hypothetical protein